MPRRLWRAVTGGTGADRGAASVGAGNLVAAGKVEHDDAGRATRKATAVPGIMTRHSRIAPPSWRKGLPGAGLGIPRPARAARNVGHVWQARRPLGWGWPQARGRSGRRPLLLAEQDLPAFLVGKGVLSALLLEQSLSLLDRRASADALEPGLQVGKVVQVLSLVLVQQHPRP